MFKWRKQTEQLKIQNEHLHAEIYELKTELIRLGELHGVVKKRCDMYDQICASPRLGPDLANLGQAYAESYQLALRAGELVRLCLAEIIQLRMKYERDQCQNDRS